jgi:hypothetical protein
VYNNGDSSSSSGGGGSRQCSHSCTYLGHQAACLMLCRCAVCCGVQIHSRGGATYITSWGKFWLSVLGVYRCAYRYRCLLHSTN